MTTKASVISLLRKHADPRGIEHWKKRSSNLESFGIGLTKLRKLAKEVGKDHRLAASLWKSDIYDAKLIAILIDDPKRMTPEQAESWVDDGLGDGYLVHTYTTCGAPLAKTAFAFELASRWVDSEDPVRRRCGYGLLYELSKRKPKGMDDEYLIDRIEIIRETIRDEEMWVRESMNTALMGIGKRNLVLNEAAIAAAEAIGPVDIDYGNDNSCEPLDVLKHLRCGVLREKLAAEAGE